MAEDFADKVKSVNAPKGKKVKARTVRHEGENHPRHGPGYKEGEVAGVHLEHDDGRVDAIVGGHPDDADYLYWLTNVKKDDE